MKDERAPTVSIDEHMSTWLGYTFEYPPPSDRQDNVGPESPLEQGSFRTRGVAMTWAIVMVVNMQQSAFFYAQKVSYARMSCVADNA